MSKCGWGEGDDVVDGERGVVADGDCGLYGWGEGGVVTDGVRVSG